MGEILSGDLIDPAHQARDVRLITSAIRKGWNIPAEILETLPEKLADIVETTEDDRAKIAAVKCLISMHGQNQRDKPVTKKVKHTHTLGPLPPVTEDTLEQRRAFLLGRINQLGDNARSDGGTGASA